MDNKRVYLGLDVGTRRIGVALGDSIGRIAHPVSTVQVDGSEAGQLKILLQDNDVTDIVVGRPRNQSGETTRQTQLVEEFADAVLSQFGLPIHWQDESVTSVVAEERLKSHKRPYSKGDIDAEAASIILQDFLG
ncbi:MAG TPA: Holliday junction resolvase RuvX [Candidatus Saccharimonadales bacterium]|nr:Holliday junction resolvase RuvX [Candidatus Saccharimonadales bacterium]